MSQTITAMNETIVARKLPEVPNTPAVFPASEPGAEPAIKNDFNFLGHIKGKWALLVFYPADFTFVCPTELLGLSERIDEFKKLSVEVLGISTDTKWSHFQWMKQSVKDGGVAGLRYPLVEDQGGAISRALGVLNPAGIKALRATYIVDPAGVVQHVTINNLPVGRSVDETLRVIQGFQYVSEHSGEVCPMDWKPGANVMKENEKGKKEFFEKRK